MKNLFCDYIGDCWRYYQMRLDDKWLKAAICFQRVWRERRCRKRLNAAVRIQRAFKAMETQWGGTYGEWFKTLDVLRLRRAVGLQKLARGRRVRRRMVHVNETCAALGSSLAAVCYLRVVRGALGFDGARIFVDACIFDRSDRKSVSLDAVLARHGVKPKQQKGSKTKASSAKKQRARQAKAEAEANKDYQIFEYKGELYAVRGMRDVQRIRWGKRADTVFFENGFDEEGDEEWDPDGVQEA